MPAGARSAGRFIGFARTTRRIERAQQLGGGSPRILHAMARTYGEINAAAGSEFTRLIVGVHNPVAFQDENAFLIGVVVDRSFARRNPSRELGDLFAAEVGIDQVTEQTVLAGANVFPKILMHQQARWLAGLRRCKIIHNRSRRAFGATLA